MPKQPEYTWMAKNILDDIQYQEDDAETFKKLLQGHKGEGEGAREEMSPGTILRGRIVEIGKDYVVVDVGLKSEGLVPTAEFTEPDELVLDNEIEVFLDRAEDENGQIVLSKEKTSGKGYMKPTVFEGLIT